MLAVLFVCFGFGLVFLLWYVGVGCYLGFSVGICCLDFCLLFKLWFVLFVWCWLWSGLLLFGVLGGF